MVTLGDLLTKEVKNKINKMLSKIEMMAQKQETEKRFLQEKNLQQLIEIAQVGTIEPDILRSLKDKTVKAQNLGELREIFELGTRLRKYALRRYKNAINKESYAIATRVVGLVFG